MRNFILNIYRQLKKEYDENPMLFMATLLAETIVVLIKLIIGTLFFCIILANFDHIT